MRRTRTTRRSWTAERTYRGAVVVSKDLEGDLSVEQTDHMVEKGADGPGRRGLRGRPRSRRRCSRPPRSVPRSVPCGGKLAAQEDRQQDRGGGRRDDPDRRRRPDRRLPARRRRRGRARGDPRDPEGGRRGGGPPRQGAQGRPGRRPAEDGREPTGSAGPCDGWKPKESRPNRRSCARVTKSTRRPNVVPTPTRR